MDKLNYILIILAVTLNLCVCENKWIWSKTNKNAKVRNYYPLAGEQYSRADRDREPTTKRPLAGQPQNDDIDDYTDVDDENAKQNSPYIPPGPVGYPLIAGNYNGFGNYPLVAGFSGNSPNGVLVGPGGPTGIIGRPQAQYPAGVAPPLFSAIPGAYPGSYPTTQNFAGFNSNPGYPAFNNLNNLVSQYPYANNNNNNPQQFAGAQYPQTHFPGLQYPQQPQYTEGYGLANTNHGFNPPLVNGNFNPNYGFGFDEYPAQVEGKSASVKTINKKVDDKVTKNLKKS